ncbi:hypothetical protein D3C72_1816130 [compost metagenome]
MPLPFVPEKRPCSVDQFRRIRPSGRSVLNGAPTPSSSAAGKRMAPDCAVQPPGVTVMATGAAMASEWLTTRRAVPVSSGQNASVHCSRPGSTVAVWLPVPADSASVALPCQSEPLASASSTRPCVCVATRAAIHAAGSIATTVTAALARPSPSQRRRRHAAGWRSLRRGSRSVSSRTISCGRPDPAGSR